LKHYSIEGKSIVYANQEIYVFFQITFDIESSSAGLRKVVLYDVLTKAAIPAVANLKLMNRLSAD